MGSGSVSLPASDCTTADGNAGYSMSSTLVITANPVEGYIFNGWSGAASDDNNNNNPLSLTMSRSAQLVAHFAAQPVSEPVGSNGGTVESMGVDVSLPPDAVPDGSQLDIAVTNETSQNSDGFVALGKQFQITLTDSQGNPITDFSDNPLQLCFPYHPDELAAVGGQADNLTVSYYNPDTQAWQEMSDGRTVDTNAQEICVEVSHLSIFALQAKAIEGMVTLQARPTAPHSSYQVPLLIELAGQGRSRQRNYQFDLYTDAFGRFELMGVAPGNYSMKLKSMHTLQRMMPITVTSEGPNTFTVPFLAEGDANNDNQINDLDKTILAAGYQLCTGSTGFDVRTDFNDDGCIKLADLSLLASNYGQVGQQRREAKNNVDLLLQPEAKTITVGQEFDLTIRVEANTPLDTVGAALNFEPSLLQVVRITASQTLDFVARNTFDNQSGQINLDAAKLGSPVESTFALATIRFRALGATSATSISFGSTSDALRIANSVLGTSSGAQITINQPDPQLTVTASSTPTATSTATSTVTPTSTPNAVSQTLYLPIIKR